MLFLNFMLLACRKTLPDLASPHKMLISLVYWFMQHSSAVFWPYYGEGICKTLFAREEEKLVREEGEYSYQIWGYAGKLVSLYNETSPHKNWSEYLCNSQTYVNSGQACLLRPRSENLKKENDCFVHPLGVGLTPRINYSFMFLFFSLEVLSLIHVFRMFYFSSYYLAG